MGRYLVTGGCGFIGSHLVAHLSGAGHEVLVVDNLSTGRRDNIAAGIDVIEADVGDTDAFRHELSGIDGCFHLAAIASVERGQVAWRETHLTNLSSFVGLLEAVAKQKSKSCPVVYASSAAVYGDNTELPLSESSNTGPISAYGADKLGCELHARVGGLGHDVPTAGLRLFNVFGPGQDPASPYSGVISIFARRALDGLPIKIFGDGEQSRDFIYVSDVVAALSGAMSAAATGLIVNVCRGRRVTINRLAETIAGLVEHDVAIEYGPQRAGDIRHSLGDPSRMKEVLGVEPAIDLEAGLRMTLDWMTTAKGAA